MKKITITNAYSWYNKGDAGILLGTVNALKKIYGEDNVEFNVLSFTPEEDKKRYCKDKSIKDVYSNVLNPHPYKHTKVGKLCAIIKLFFKMLCSLILININKNSLIKNSDSYRVLDECDFIVVCGGGFLGGKKLDSLMHVFQMYVDTKFEKPVYFIGTSIEPMANKLVKKYTNKVLSKMDHIFAREVITYDYLKSIGLSNKTTLIPDMAFMLEDYEEKFEEIENIRKKSKTIYGITVRDWNFPNSDDPKEKMNNYINALIEFMNFKIEKENAAFVFVPQVIVSYGNDVVVAEKIKKKLKPENKNNFLIINEDLTPLEIKALINNLDYFIGTRMHSNIFATSMKIPTVAIAYEKKTNGIMHTVGLDDYIIEIDDIIPEVLIEKTKLQSKNYKNIVKSLNIQINKIREEIINLLKEKIVGRE